MKKNKSIHPFYAKMLAAKFAKASKSKRIKKTREEEVPKEKPDLFSGIPKKEGKRIEVTENIPMSSMEEHTSTQHAMERALDRIREHAKDF